MAGRGPVGDGPARGLGARVVKGGLSWRALLGEALGLWFASRVLYLVIGLGVSAFRYGRILPGGVMSFKQPWGAWLFALLYKADSAFYFSIAVKGYPHVPYNTAKQYTWPFFPLYPYLTRFTHLLGIHVIYAGYVWTGLSMVATLVIVGRMVGERRGGRAGLLAMWLVALSPLTAYFVGYRAGALFLALTAASLYALGRERWIWAVAAGALASLARPVGILLVVPYLVALWLAVADWPRRIWYTLAGAGFATGFVVLAIVDRHLTGNPLAFLDAQSAWGRKTEYPFYAAIRWLAKASPHLTVQGGWAFPLLAVLSTVLSLLAVLYLIRQGRSGWPWAAYTLVTVVLANASSTFEGLPRFIAELPPVYAALAMWAAGRMRREWYLVAVTAALFACYTALWALGVHAVQN